MTMHLKNTMFKCSGKCDNCRREFYAQQLFPQQDYQFWCAECIANPTLKHAANATQADGICITCGESRPQDTEVEAGRPCGECMHERQFQPQTT